MNDVLETIYELSKTVIFVLVMAFLIRFFIFQPFVVEGASMEPHLHNKEYLIVDRLSYMIREPQRGDVVVFQSPSDPNVDYIKRIIALPKEHIDINNGVIKINEAVLDEEYLPVDFVTYINDNPDLKLEKNLGNSVYFVMGDNRSHSLDSRVFGVINKNAIIGRAIFVLYPWEYFGRVFEPTY